MADDGGLSRLQARLRAIPEEVTRAVRPALVKQAENMARTMRTFAPVKSGDLRDSIVVTPPSASTPPYSQPGGAMLVPETTAVVTAGNKDVRYAHLVEYGHQASGWNEGGSVVPPHPFFWPAVRLHNKRAKRAIKSAVSRAVKKNWGRS